MYKAYNFFSGFSGYYVGEFFIRVYLQIRLAKISKWCNVMSRNIVRNTPVKFQIIILRIDGVMMKYLRVRWRKILPLWCESLRVHRTVWNYKHYNWPTRHGGNSPSAQVNSVEHPKSGLWWSKHHSTGSWAGWAPPGDHLGWSQWALSGPLAEPVTPAGTREQWGGWLPGGLGVEAQRGLKLLPAPQIAEGSRRAWADRVF